MNLQFLFEDIAHRQLHKMNQK